MKQLISIISNRFNILLLFSSITFFLNSCEETVSNIELPYEEKLVIRGILTAGDTINNIAVTRTLPPLEEATYENSLVSDAVLEISENFEGETKIYKLNFLSNYKYGLNNLIAKEGANYTLKIEWKNIKATASTSIPKAIDTLFLTKKIEKYRYRYDNYPYWNIIYYANFKSKDENYYLGGYTSMNNSDMKEPYWYNYSNDIIIGKSTSLSKIEIYNTITSDTNYSNQTFFETLFVDNFDPQIYKYYLSKRNGSSTSAIFGASGQNVSFNINGDALGMFIGRSTYFQNVKIE